MAGYLQDAMTKEFLEEQWSQATTHRQMEIARAIKEFIRAHRSTNDFGYWEGLYTSSGFAL